MFSSIKLKDRLYFFDIFGVRPSFYFKNKKKTGTLFGLCLSFLLISFTFVCFFFFGQDLYDKTNPQILYSEEYTPLPEEFVIDPEKSPFLLEINDPFGQIYYKNPEIVRMTVSQVKIWRDSQGNINHLFQDYAMEACSREHMAKLDENTRNYFENLNLADFFCIPRNLKNLSIAGAFDQKIFKTIRFKISVCSGNSQCLPAETIKSQMNKGFVGLYFVDFNLNPGDYTSPRKPQPKEVFTNFFIETQKEINVFFRNNVLETDDGLVFKSQQKQQFLTFDSETDMEFHTSDNDFISIYLKMRQKTSLYYRSYRKLQEVMAQIGGFTNFFWIFAFLLNYLYSHLLIISETINNVFTIKVSYENQPRNQKNFFNVNPLNPRNLEISSDSRDILQRNSQNPGENPEIPKKPDKTRGFLEYLKKINGRLFDFASSSTKTRTKPREIPKKPSQIPEKLEKNAVKLRFLDYFYFYTGLFRTPERETKRIVINEGSRIPSKCLDVKFIIQKFYELEKLKKIVLPQEEFANFKRLPKPELKIVLQNTKNEKTSVVRRDIFIETSRKMQENKTFGEEL